MQGAGCQLPGRRFPNPHAVVGAYGVASCCDRCLLPSFPPIFPQVLFDYFLDPSLAGDAGFIEESLAASHRVQLEDVALCESVQRGLASAAYDTGRWGVGAASGLGHGQTHNLLPSLVKGCIVRQCLRLAGVCRYAPGVEGPMFHFHQLLHADLAAEC